MAGRHLWTRRSPASTGPDDAGDDHAPAGLLDDEVLEQLLADGEIDGADFAYCPRQDRVTAHSLHTDGSQSCIDCTHTTASAG